MITLRRSNKSELEIFDEIDHQDHASNFITQIGLKAHQNYFEEPNVIYLSIENDAKELAGYIVLVVESDHESIEFRRISIDHKKRGVGQLAIKEMESFSKKELGAKRIWLDVFEDNNVGRYIYKKLGYRSFKEGITQGRKILFYEKVV